jgi:hypothetical protein
MGQCTEDQKWIDGSRLDPDTGAGAVETLSHMDHFS